MNEYKNKKPTSLEEFVMSRFVSARLSPPTNNMTLDSSELVSCVTVSFCISKEETFRGLVDNGIGVYDT